jgi:hypothetical protein
VNDTIAVAHHSISHLKKDDGLHMPLPLPPSQRTFTSASEHAELIQQMQLNHFTLSHASASNHVNYTHALFRHAFDRKNQGAQYNQLFRRRWMDHLSLNTLYSKSN